MAGEATQRIRVLAADDSAVMRHIFATVFRLHALGGNGLPAMELCGLARDGEDCLLEIERLRPDALVLDMEMPRLDGLGVLRRLKDAGSTLPVILCSAHTERGARATLEALSLGARDYVMKPWGAADLPAALNSLQAELLPRLAACVGRFGAQPASVCLQPLAGHAARRETTAIGKDHFRAAGPGADSGIWGAAEATAGPRGGAGSSAAAAAGSVRDARIEAVVIAISTGGPAALEAMLPRLSREFPVPVLIVQHMPKLFTGALAQRLNRMCRMPVREATHGALAEPGTVWLASGDAHLEVARAVARDRCSPARLELHVGPALNSCRPSADYLFRSAARIYGHGTLALVMTGMGQDGYDGACAVRAAGGTVLAQDERTSAVWGMPGRVAAAGLAEALVPLGELASALQTRVAERGDPSYTHHAAAAATLDQRQEGSLGLYR